MNKKNTSGKVFDRIDKLCMWTLAYDANVPKKYRRTLWEPMRMYLDNAQACAEMAYLENDLKEKFNLVKEARKYFRIFKRYQYRCDMTGEFKFGNVYSVNMLEHIMLIEGELNRWFASLNKLVSNGAVADIPVRKNGHKRDEEPEYETKESGYLIYTECILHGEVTKELLQKEIDRDLFIRYEGEKPIIKAEDFLQ